MFMNRTELESSQYLRDDAFSIRYHVTVIKEICATTTTATTPVLHIDDVEPRVFEALLHFMYTDRLPEIDDRDKAKMAQQLHAVADRYDLQGLKQLLSNAKTKTLQSQSQILKLQQLLLLNAKTKTPQSQSQSQLLKLQQLLLNPKTKTPQSQSQL
ncbi:hypothetical protein PR202_ga22520 [Eleusine coracana subsp. coracana]|uniref:BTB domain-containing protein n=1 Tax=Eleusine coracana subsp. coracana TaxID=191504 RepID=A0AAV5D3F3_ELECO|nr:hypothetical protein PR202_ga22520 [Eleusine coracana subsp. coracana]